MVSSVATMQDPDTELEEFRDELAWMLVRLGPMSRDAAKAIVAQDPTFNPTTSMSRMMLLHETPYYWAMSHLHGKEDPPWYKQPGNWPPPPELWRQYDSDKASGAWRPIHQDS